LHFASKEHPFRVLNDQKVRFEPTIFTVKGKHVDD